MGSSSLVISSLALISLGLMCGFFFRPVEAAYLPSSSDVSRKEDTVCYPEVGCFVRGEGPLAHIGFNPSNPAHIETQFLLWRKETSIDSPIVLSSLSLAQDLAGVEDLDPSLPLIVVCHGLGDNGYSEWVVTMVSRLLNRMDANVVSVHWEKGADKSNYLIAARNTELVGRQLGNLVDAIMAFGLPQDKVHLIGHSLGSQISNFAVNWLRQVSDVVSDFTPGRISGLDPASPLFCDGNYGIDTYLEWTDADFVDVYHSNQGKIIYGNVGCEGVYGHVDFYPNGGYDQPGCPNPIIGVIEDLFSGDGFNAACSHFRAVHIFSESLVADPDHFRAFPCPGLDDFDNDFLTGDCFQCRPNEEYAAGCGKAGMDAPLYGNGSFYFPTYADDPQDGVDQLGGRMMRISIKSSMDQDRITWGQFGVTIKDPLHGDMGPYYVTTTDAAVSHGETNRRVFLNEVSFSVGSSSSSSSPAAAEMTIEVTYTAYDGFFDGSPTWFVDGVVVEDDLENRFYRCQEMFQLDSEVAQEMTLVQSNVPLC